MASAGSEAARRRRAEKRRGAISDDERDRPVTIEVITANGGWYGWSGTRTGCEGKRGRERTSVKGSVSGKWTFGVAVSVCHEISYKKGFSLYGHHVS